MGSDHRGEDGTDREGEKGWIVKSSIVIVETMWSIMIQVMTPVANHEGLVIADHDQQYIVQD